MPLSFRGSDEKERPIDLHFDWDRKRVTGTAKEHAVDASCRRSAGSDVAADRLAAQSRERQPAEQCALVDGAARSRNTRCARRQRQIETALGKLDTIVYTSKRAGSDRLLRSWVAPALGYLPVKAERDPRKKVEFTCTIESVDRAEKGLDHARRRTAPSNFLHQVFGSVTPFWPWYLPPRSLYEVSQTSSDSKNSTCATPSLA